MTLKEFFNPCDPDHVEAYVHLRKKGQWPEGFLPKCITVSPSGEESLEMTLARFWVNHVMYEHNRKPRL